MSAGASSDFYSTLSGTTTSLTSLKNNLSALKKKCDSQILERKNDEWQKIQEIIQSLYEEIDGIKETCTSCGSDMKTIDESLN